MRNRPSTNLNSRRNLVVHGYVLIGEMIVLFLYIWYVLQALFIGHEKTNKFSVAMPVSSARTLDFYLFLSVIGQTEWSESVCSNVTSL